MMQQPGVADGSPRRALALDIIVGQTLALRRRYDVALPLVLMDSESTREPTLEALAAHAEFDDHGLALDFLQSVIPKLDADTLEPVSWAGAPAMEWVPPGHGDVYGALRRSGMLDALRERGRPRDAVECRQSRGQARPACRDIHMAQESIPHLMEVVQGTGG